MWPSKDFRIRMFVTMLRFIELQSPALIRAWQERRLQMLITHSARYIQLYGELLARHAILASDIKSLTDVKRLPILDKESFARRPIEDIIDVSHSVNTSWVKTSGTSGRPFTFLQGSLTSWRAFGDFMTLRFLFWKRASIRTVSDTRVVRIKIRSARQPNRLFIPVHELLSDPAYVLSSLIRFAPEVIESYQSILVELAKYVRSQDARRQIRVPYIISFGEMLPEATRKFIEETFEAELFNRYGVEEIGVIGTECSQHDGFHVHSDSVYIEIVDHDGVAVPEGSRGRVIATDLHNFNMPFIRYDTGDSGYITNAPCTCGLSTPRIWIEGRYASFIEVGGRRIHHLEFDGAMDGFMRIVRQYQIAKTGPHEICVRIIPAQGFGEGSSDEIESALRALVGDRASIRIQPVETIAITPRGKTQILVDETNAT